MSAVDTLEGKFYLPHCFIFTTAPIRMIIIDENGTKILSIVLGGKNYINRSEKPDKKCVAMTTT